MTNAERVTLREHVAAEVRAWMARRGVTGEVLSEELGVSRAWVSRRLRADTAMDSDDLEAIAKVLDVPVASLLRYPLEAVSAGAEAPAPRRRRRLAAVAESAPPAAAAGYSASPASKRREIEFMQQGWSARRGPDRAVVPRSGVPARRAA